MLKNKYNDMVIDFDEANHVYAVNGNIADISVTALLRKHGLAPNYSSAQDKILQQAILNINFHIYIIPIYPNQNNGNKRL